VLCDGDPHTWDRVLALERGLLHLIFSASLALSTLAALQLGAMPYWWMMNDRAMGASHSSEQGSFLPCCLFLPFHPPALLGLQGKEDLFSSALDAISLTEG
jgi:hypothetical protein